MIMLVKKILSRRGQAMVLYALLIPVLFLFVGVGIDLGWYFINVSRLQNAADAAALAGAQALVKQDDFNKYLVVSLSSNELPADFDDYEDVYKNTFDSTTSKTGVLHNYRNIEDVEDALKVGRNFVEEYARKNLADTEKVVDSDNNKYNLVTAMDGWGLPAADKKVSGKIELKYKIVDGKNDVYGPLYYVVNLTEKIRHLFMPGWFEPMEAPVKAVVLLRPHYRGLIEPMEQLERTKVIDNWEYANKYKGTTNFYDGKWNHYQAGIRGKNEYGIRYADGSTYRNESVFVSPSRKTSGQNIIASAQGSSGEATDANGGKWYLETQVDSINIDFRAEVKGKFSTDWDIGQDFAETGHSYQFAEGWSATDGANKRILFNAEFDTAFKTRDTSKQADPLWVRIESDPIKNPYTGAGVSNFNSVRQVTLNFNDDNTIVEGDHYKYRPYVIFYDGPENIDYALDENGVLKRHSQPVVLNLNEDLNAIIYMPNSPVIINGNNHALHGFVIAKCYLKSVTEEEITGNSSITRYDGFNAPSPFECGYLKGTDGYGNTIYVKQGDLIARETVDATYPSNKNFTITEDEDGNLTVTGKINAPQYPIISFTKDLYTNCKTLDEYFEKTAEYINSNYTKAKYAQYAGIDESAVSMIKFPEEKEVIRDASGKIINNPDYDNFTAIRIPVATADLLDSDPDPDVPTKDNKYVKVMLLVEPTGDSSEPQYVEKYIAKSKLPHMRIKRNDVYPYVCLYDLKTGLGNKRKDGFSGVKPTDDSITAPSNKDDNSAVVFLNSGNEYKDVWVINLQLLENTYYKEYIASKLTFATETESGFRYFNRNSEINNKPQVVAEYRKVVVGVDSDGKEIVKYVKEGDKLYYMKVNNNTNHPENNNYIITDENGNILTKPVTAPELRIPEDVDSVTENAALALKTNLGGALSDYWNTYTREPKDPEEIPGDRGTIDELNNRYVGRSDYRKDEDYRVPAFERVYQMKTFNLSDSDSGDSGKSYYSYFDIEELWRVNYTYLNVDEINHTVDRKTPEETGDTWQVEDMFFTTTRSGWID